jgi:hypothetical protein
MPYNESNSYINAYRRDSKEEQKNRGLADHFIFLETIRYGGKNNRIDFEEFYNHMRPVWDFAATYVYN